MPLLRRRHAYFSLLKGFQLGENLSEGRLTTFMDPELAYKTDKSILKSRVVCQLPWLSIGDKNVDHHPPYRFFNQTDDKIHQKTPIYLIIDI